MKESVIKLADHLNNRQYRSEISISLEVFAKNNNLAIVFGASDDLIEFRGAFEEEFGASEELYFDKEFKIISSHSKIRLDEKDVYMDDFVNIYKFDLEVELKNKITQEWQPKDNEASWRLSANFPHKTFNIFDKESLYCVGIVFDIDDLL